MTPMFLPRLILSDPMRRPPSRTMAAAPPAATLPLAMTTRFRAMATSWSLLPAAWLAAMLFASPASCATASPAVREVLKQVQSKIVKIHGAGGLRGLEPYQTGFLVSPQGHILTAFSYVLDGDSVAATLADGRKFEAKLVGADPRLELAVLKIEAVDLPWFDLGQSQSAEIGTRILALSNLFGVASGSEPASVQHGTVASKTVLDARRGTFDTPYKGPVYVLDVVTNNPGAAGGALVNRRGELLGVLGKELRNARNNTYLNYALPIDQIRDSVEQIRAGKFVARKPDEPVKKPARPVTLELLGISLIPDVLERTPPYVDGVAPGSPSTRAGIAPDDLIVLVGERLVRSAKMLRAELDAIDYEDKVRLTVLRGQELREVEVQFRAEEKR
jgi:S1-C subfamily serine protease